jgi:hypothetical protein
MATFRIWSTLAGAWLAGTCSATAAQSASRRRARQVEASRKSEWSVKDADKRKGRLAKYPVVRSGPCRSRAAQPTDWFAEPKTPRLHGTDAICV